MSRLPETGPSLRRYLRKQQRQVQRQGQASPYTLSGTSVTAEDEVTVTGQMQSGDYDGTSRADLGATGWMLGPDDGGPSLLALNGIDVYADLAAKAAALAAQDVKILAQTAALAAQDAQILALIGQQVTGTTGTNNVSGVALGSPANYAVVTFTVPAGFTRATVIGTSGVFYAGVSAVIAANVNIAGVMGFSQKGAVSFSNVFVANSATLTGLTGGGTFTVSSRVERQSAESVDAYIVTTAMVTFLR